MKILRVRGCHKVRSEVYATNYPAMSLCKRMGFKKEGLFRDDEGHHDLLIWSKFIAQKT